MVMQLFSFWKQIQTQTVLIRKNKINRFTLMKKQSSLLFFILCILSSGFSQESFLINNTQVRFWLKPVLMNNIKFKMIDRIKKH